MALTPLGTSDGSDIADWGKYTSRTFQSPSGPAQVHFHYNPVTGAVNYDIRLQDRIQRGPVTTDACSLHSDHQPRHRSVALRLALGQHWLRVCSDLYPGCPRTTRRAADHRRRRSDARLLGLTDVHYR